MEALLLIVVLVVLFVLLRYYRGGKSKFSSQLKNCLDQHTLMIVLREDLQQEIKQQHFSAAFEKALVLLGLYDKVITMFRDESFIDYLKDPKNQEGQKLLHCVDKVEVSNFLEQHAAILQHTYRNGLWTLLQLNQQLNLDCKVERWNRPSAEDQKHLPDVTSLEPVLKHLLEQRLSLCQQIIELSLLLIGKETAQLIPSDLHQNLSKPLAQGCYEPSLGVGADFDFSTCPQVPQRPYLPAITQNDEPKLELQQLYTKYQKILSLVLASERLTCMNLHLINLLPLSSTKLQDLEKDE